MADASPAVQAQARVAAAEGWYKDAVIYQVHVKSFFDGNDDGIGDFPGLTAKLDYIASLGVDTLWLLPFYPSPRRDDGYDVADYFGVHADYGNFDDLKTFLAAAHARGLRVLGDLVLNHTSDTHPWFQRARHAPRGSAEHEFYVWSDSDQRYPGTRIIFPDVEKSNWTWDPVAERYYFHRFYAHQPDLNFDNPQVMEAMLGVLRHWLDAGLDGFRLDAVAYLAERDGTSNENLPETHAILKRLRAEIDRHYPDRILLAEANQWPEDMQEYFGRDDECHMAFHFPLMPRMYMAIAQEDRFPISDILRQTPDTPPKSQWAIFLRNHDELTLEMVTDAERDYLWNTYAADPRARINLGIRRRLAPLLERDRRRIELMTALLLTLPGTPVLYYGDEIGMGDNIHLGDRDGVRTPMQWSVDRNGGFSRADAQRLVLPTIMDPLYGYHAVNVEAQERDPHSLLHWTRRVLAVRRRYGGLFGRGRLDFVYPHNRKVLVYLREFEGVTLLCIANLARSLQAVELDLSAFEGRVPIDIIGGAALPPIGRSVYLITLPAYGFHAFELAGRERLPDWYRPDPEPLPELTTLVLRGELFDALREPQSTAWLRGLLPRWLHLRGWNPAPDGEPPELLRTIEIDSETALFELGWPDGARRWLPLSVSWEGRDPQPAVPPQAIARVRRGARVGHLVDALSVRSVLERWRDAWTGAATTDDAVEFVAEPDAAALPPPRNATLEAVAGDASVSLVRLDHSLLITFARRGAQAVERPLALQRRLQAAGFARTLPLLGTLRVRDSGETLAMAQAWPPTQGDALHWTLDFLRRSLHEARAADETQRAQWLRGYEPFATLLGTRLAELHRALAGPGDEAGAMLAAAEFKTAADDLLADYSRLEPRLHAGGIPAEVTSATRRRLRTALAALPDLALCDRDRIHGQLLLSNVLLDVDDLRVFDFASPSSLLQFGGRTCVLSDVGDVLFAFDHAAASIAHEFPGNEEATYLAAFRVRAREVFLAAYRSETRGAGWLRGPGRDRRALRLFQAWRALQVMDCAPHTGALTVAWQALQTSLQD
jgi:maltose alpha-D-glucosyltransferase/alpha-amylase